MSSINDHLEKIKTELNDLLADHVDQPNEMSAVESIRYRIDMAEKTFLITKNINED
jgi:hypothetical protein